MEKIEINKIIKQLDHIPALPEVVSKILDKLDDPNTSMFGLGKIIQSDMAFAAKILQIVNSAFYGVSQKVTSLGQAITMLGFKTLKSAIVGMSIIKAFGGAKMDVNAGSLLAEKEKTFAPEGLWAHSLGVAASARCIAKRIIPHESEEAFIAGIIHDIGKLVVYQYFNETHSHILAAIAEKDTLYSKVEKNILPISHSEIGYRVAKVWKLPDNLADAVLYHHNPTNAPKQNKTIVEIIHVADVFARSLQLGSGWDDKIPRLDEKSFSNLGFHSKDVDGLLKASLAEYNNANIFTDL